jgi:hypothetical protein
MARELPEHTGFNQRRCVGRRSAYLIRDDPAGAARTGVEVVHHFTDQATPMPLPGRLLETASPEESNCYLPP